VYSCASHTAGSVEVYIHLVQTENFAHGAPPGSRLPDTSAKKLHIKKKTQPDKILGPASAPGVDEAPVTS
jgi:hypothetical protein